MSMERKIGDPVKALHKQISENEEQIKGETTAEEIENFTPLEYDEITLRDKETLKKYSSEVDPRVLQLNKNKELAPLNYEELADAKDRYFELKELIADAESYDENRVQTLLFKGDLTDKEEKELQELREKGQLSRNLQDMKKERDELSTDIIYTNRFYKVKQNKNFN